MAAFCTSCGAQLTGPSRFCTSCGAPVGAQPGAAPAPAAPPPPTSAAPPPWAGAQQQQQPWAPPQQQQQQQQPWATPQPQQPWAPPQPQQPWMAAPPAKKKGHTLRNILLGVIVVIAAAIGGSLLMTAGPADAVERHLSLVQAGDLQTAYAEAAPSFRQTATMAQFTQIVTSYPILKKSTASWTSREVNGDEALIKGTLTGSDGKRANVEYHLSRGADDKWRVMGFGVVPVP